MEFVSIDEEDREDNGVGSVHTYIWHVQSKTIFLLQITDYSPIFFFATWQHVNQYPEWHSHLNESNVNS